MIGVIHRKSVQFPRIWVKRGTVIPKRFLVFKSAHQISGLMTVVITNLSLFHFEIYGMDMIKS